MKKTLMRIALVMIMMVGVMGMALPAQAETPTIGSVRQKLQSSEHGVLNVVGTVTIDDMTEDELFAYISNLENDVNWYPGTLSSQKLSGDGGAGTQYLETVYFFGTQIPVTATVLQSHDDHSFWFTSDGIFTNLTHYTVHKVGDNKVEFRLDSTVEASNGVTKEFFQQYMYFTFQSLLNALGKTGTIEVK